jgi:hypothetical protein
MQRNGGTKVPPFSFGTGDGRRSSLTANSVPN